MEKRFINLTETQLRGMIHASERKFPFLEQTSVENLMFYGRLMSERTIILKDKPTPAKATYRFLEDVGAEALKDKSKSEQDKLRLNERDFVFLVVMFNYKMVMANGLIKFVDDYANAETADKRFEINDARTAKELDIAVCKAAKLTQVQNNMTESAYNKLLRHWRDERLALQLGELIREGRTIGEAREHLRDPNVAGLKDHEFQRVRRIALESGQFESKRKTSIRKKKYQLTKDNEDYVIAVRDRLDGKGSVEEVLNLIINEHRKLVAA